MSALPTPAQEDIFAALSAFLTSILPSGVEVIQAQANRVAEPQGADFVVMTVVRQQRLSTNVEAFQDTKFVGFIEADQMVVDEMTLGSLDVGSSVFGPGVAAGTEVTALETGTGGAGVYRVSPSQVAPGPLLWSDGFRFVTQSTKVTVRVDVHSDDMSTASDYAQSVSTLFRDPYGVATIQASNPNVAPLYSEDPRQMPFLNDQQQVESRWGVEVHLQANQTVALPQQFFDAISVELISVDATDPA